MDSAKWTRILMRQLEALQKRQKRGVSGRARVARFEKRLAMNPKWRIRTKALVNTCRKKRRRNSMALEHHGA